MKTCPYCLKEISDSGVVCKYCKNTVASNNPIITLPWGLKDLFLILIFTFIAYYSLAFIFSFLLMFFGLDRNSTTLIVNNFFYIIFCGAIFVNVSIRHNRNFFKSLNIFLPSKIYLLLTPLIATILFYLFNLLPSLSEEPIMGQLLISPLNVTIHIVAAVILAPITEEIVWRGYILPIIQKKTGIVTAVFLVATLFMLSHLPQLFGAWPILIKIFIGGLIYTLARVLTNSTITSILIHFFYNLIIALAFIFKF